MVEEPDTALKEKVIQYLGRLDVDVIAVFINVENPSVAEVFVRVSNNEYALIKLVNGELTGLCELSVVSIKEG